MDRWLLLIFDRKIALDDFYVIEKKPVTRCTANLDVLLGIQKRFEIRLFQVILRLPGQRFGSTNAPRLGLLDLQAWRLSTTSP
jgi:hypothetical protein